MDLLRKDEDFFSFCEALHEERDVDHSSNSFFFSKEVFSFQMPFVHKNFLSFAFISKIYINIRVYALNTTNTINTTTSNMSRCVRGIFQYVIFP